MGWSNKDFNPDTLSQALLTVMQKILSRANNLPQTQPPAVEANEITEYEGRMRVSGFEKLNSTCYVSAVNFYLNQADMDKHKTKGALVLYIETENSGKFYKALDIKFADDEDDASMMEACGNMVALIGEMLKTEINNKGYAQLLVSKPVNYKNNILKGIEISRDQKMKHELGFYYFKHKAIVVELSLAPIPTK
jgi:hypothetical protein